MANNSGGFNDAFARLHVSEKPIEGKQITTTTISSHSPTSYRDVTQLFRQACQGLDVGQLVKDPNFTLFEAVGALEIMDPKMDSGLLKPGEDDTPSELYQPVLPEEIIGIMDQLLSSEMSWHDGAALSQTVFTCLYIDNLLSLNPSSLEEAKFNLPPSETHQPGSPTYQLLHIVLRAYCVGLIKCCERVNLQILAEHTYEEEDFVTQTYNVSLLDFITVAEINKLLVSAIEYVDSTAAPWPNNIKMALKARLAFRKLFLTELSRDVKEMVDKRSNWDGCITLLSTIGITRNLGIAVPSVFSIAVQRKLASTVPPRPIVQIPFEEAFTIVSRLCKDAKEILRVLTYSGATNLMTFFLRFTARKPQPSTYVRSLLQTLFFSNHVALGRMQISHILLEDVKELCLPADDLFDPRNELSEMPSDTRFQIHQRMKWFVERAGNSYITLYRTICQNRSRLRRNLCHLIVDWDALQIECEEIDGELQQLIKEEPVLHNDNISYAFSLSSWVYHYKLRQMEWIIFLGFELEVYLPHEFAGMYWYLQYFLRTRLQHLERIRHFVHPGVAVDSPLAATRSKECIASAQDIANAQATVNFTLLEAAALQELCSAMIFLYTALARLGLVKTPPQPYSTDVMRYELRMKPFLTIGCPDVVPFEDFKALVDNPDIETVEMLEMASENTKEGRKNFDLLSKMSATSSHALLCEEGYRLNLREYLRSCIGAGVAIVMLLKAIKTNTVADVEVEIDQGSYHPWFPVPRISSKKRPPLPAVPPTGR
ncbi:hypothetical protein TWF788_002165 [Orbilia oligospora]|uniref:N-alpha-acetyltransferase 35, NatC auxiliary subunit n=1 Tax=Orbilia oligospora TaxID=2813651 RepID=A0A6G1MH59_ORBOL|nr:hypothetical protein TWF788_002165 [Orbilia oligospora]KAF3200560.1 hypothetical protein TWF679_000727 [Orbilia oligospora]KAF3255889.1 hypothetical protein TWF192_002325 [Orbilia oligospora]